MLEHIQFKVRAKSYKFQAPKTSHKARTPVTVILIQKEDSRSAVQNFKILSIKDVFYGLTLVYPSVL